MIDRKKQKYKSEHDYEHEKETANAIKYKTNKT